MAGMLSVSMAQLTGVHITSRAQRHDISVLYKWMFQGCTGGSSHKCRQTGSKNWKCENSAHTHARARTHTHTHTLKLSLAFFHGLK
jgi:hypothetical protein